MMNTCVNVHIIELQYHTHASLYAMLGIQKLTKKKGQFAIKRQ